MLLLKILLFTVFIQSCICGLYYTTIISNEVYMYNFTSRKEQVIASNQLALAKITNNNQRVFWVSGKNILYCTKGIWLDTTIFAKTAITIMKRISSIHASDTNLYWSIGNTIYTKPITEGSSISIFYASSNLTTVITSMVYVSYYDVLMFVNGSTSLYLVDISSTDIQILDYANTIRECGIIYDIHIIGGLVFMVTNGESRGYGCIFKGSIQDLENLNRVQQTGIGRFDLMDIAINSTALLSLHHNTNCLTTIFYDVTKYCVPELLGYLGGASFDVDT